MSILANFGIFQRPWRGYVERGLPVGMWIGQGSLLGTASGGAQSIGLVFKSEGEQLGARFYNVEQIEVHTTEVTATAAALVIENFDIVSTTGLINRRMTLPLGSDSVTDSAMNTAGPRLPIFLGRPQLVGLSANLKAERSNSLNETLFFTAQGYIWEPRSLLEDGGLRRPLDSLYG